MSSRSNSLERMQVRNNDSPDTKIQPTEFEFPDYFEMNVPNPHIVANPLSPIGMFGQDDDFNPDINQPFQSQDDFHPDINQPFQSQDDFHPDMNQFNQEDWDVPTVLSPRGQNIPYNIQVPVSPISQPILDPLEQDDQKSNVPIAPVRRRTSSSHLPAAEVKQPVRPDRRRQVRPVREHSSESKSRVSSREEDNPRVIHYLKPRNEIIAVEFNALQIRVTQVNLTLSIDMNRTIDLTLLRRANKKRVIDEKTRSVRLSTTFEHERYRVDVFASGLLLINGIYPELAKRHVLKMLQGYGLSLPWASVPSQIIAMDILFHLPPFRLQKSGVSILSGGTIKEKSKKRKPYFTFQYKINGIIHEFEIDVEKHTILFKDFKYAGPTTWEQDLVKIFFPLYTAIIRRI